MPIFDGFLGLADRALRRLLDMAACFCLGACWILHVAGRTTPEGRSFLSIAPVLLLAMAGNNLLPLVVAKIFRPSSPEDDAR